MKGINMFPHIDIIQSMLDEIAESIPQDLYAHLNQGIVLLPQAKTHPRAKAGNLYILGEYTRGQTGRGIRIYYGSFRATYPYLEGEALKERLRETLIHEFRHHWESMARENDLELEDRQKLNLYLDSMD